MRNRSWFIALVFVFIPLMLNAADADKLLNGRRVNDYLSFQVNGTTVHVRVDDRTGATLTDGITFTSPGEIDLVYPNYNPFLMQISLEETVSEDPTSKAVSGFVEALLGMAKAIVPLPKTSPPAPQQSLTQGLDGGPTEPPDCAKIRAKCLVRKRATTFATETTRNEALGSCEQEFITCRCLLIPTEIQEAKARISALRDIAVNPDVANDWIDKAKGKKGISTVRKEIEDKQSKVLDGIDEATEAMAVLKALAKEYEELHCQLSDPDIPTARDVQDLEKDVDGYIAAATKLAKSLEDLATMLSGYENARWRRDNRDWVFGSVPTDPAQIKTQKITFTSREAKPATNGTVIALTDGDKETRTFDVRRYRRLVPEVGVAMIYSDLQFPKYTAVEVPAVAGESEKSFKVGKETEDGKIDAALMLNFLCNCIGDETIFPGFQVGISKADDYPGLLAGFSLRFAGLKQISIGTGAMVTWFKEPKTLKVDGPVASQDALDKDLHRHRSPVAWYLGIQYIF